MELEIFQVDAFATKLFEGNPAGVCILDQWLPETTMQAIAMEKNLSETAFVVKEKGLYSIRWFTPSTEVKLCGHATLASAHILFQEKHITEDTICFNSLSGELRVKSMGNEYEMNFPSNPPNAIEIPTELEDVLGIDVIETWKNDDLIAIVDSEEKVKSLSPDIPALKDFPYRGICVTAPSQSRKFDFIARFFAPSVGIDEDPVTGSLYTVLTPFYADMLGCTEFTAYQASKRGGIIKTSLSNDKSRVLISGQAVTAMRSRLIIDL